MMIRHWTTLLAVAAAFVPVTAQNAPQPERLLTRRYVESNSLQYLMKGQNDGTGYDVRLTATTTKDAEGRFAEEFAWSNHTDAEWLSGVRRQGDVRRGAPRRRHGWHDSLGDDGQPSDEDRSRLL
jgi:hypothetical protein